MLLTIKFLKKIFFLDFNGYFSTHILLDLMAGLLITGVLLGEDRNYFFLPLGSTDTLLRILALIMLFSL